MQVWELSSFILLPSSLEIVPLACRHTRMRLAYQPPMPRQVDRPIIFLLSSAIER